jgi:hypothetical protein
LRLRKYYCFWGKEEIFMRKVHKDLLIQVGVASAILLAPTVVEAFTGIDAGARRLHAKVVNIGKWIIIIKGSVDCIQSVLNGDIQRAKQQFFGYLLCFGIMLALPWGLEEVEALFK